MANPNKNPAEQFNDNDFETVQTGDYPAYWQCDSEEGGSFLGIPVAFDDTGESEYGPVRRIIFRAVVPTKCWRGEDEEVVVQPGEMFTLIARTGMKNFTEAFMNLTVKVTQKPAREIKNGKTFIPYSIDVHKKDLPAFKKATAALAAMVGGDRSKLPNELQAS